jgi:hypothetical protein
MSPTRKPGRPPAGRRAGERVRDYDRLTLRLPQATRALLDAWSRHVKAPVWRIIDDTVLAAYKALPASEQRKLREEMRKTVEE